MCPTLEKLRGMMYSRTTMSFTYNPKKKKRARTHGFLARMSTTSGKNVVNRRRAKGRKRVTV
jgi:large subunit ribosomal protein L34